MVGNSAGVSELSNIIKTGSGRSSNFLNTNVRAASGFGNSKSGAKFRAMLSKLRLTVPREVASTQKLECSDYTALQYPSDNCVFP